MNLSLEEIARAVGGMLDGPGNVKVRGYSIDTRTLNPGELFFAIKGPHFDGHDFVQQALDKKAAAVVVETPTPGPSIRVVSVSDALQALARDVRRRWGVTIIGVTGSAGKTTTKEMIAAVLGKKFTVLRSVGNLNNEFGLPLCLLRAEKYHHIGVLEMGMSAKGEIRRLASIAEPNEGVITNVNPVHLEFFKSVDEIAEAKAELLDGLVDMSGANASPAGRSDQERSGANASPAGRSDQERSGANASPAGRSDQERSGANASPAGRSDQERSGANASPAGRSDQERSGANASPAGRSDQERSGANASPAGRSDQERSGANASPAGRSDLVRTAYLNNDDSRVRAMARRFTGRIVSFGVKSVAAFKVQQIQDLGLDGTAFTVHHGRRDINFILPLLGQHNVANAIAAISVGVTHGVPWEQIREAVSEMKPEKMRGEVIKFREGFALIDDSYNSNPRALSEMLRFIGKLAGYQRKIVVAGEMLELGHEGADLHRNCGREAAKAGLEMLIAVQGQARQILEGALEAGMSQSRLEFAKDAVQAGDILARTVKKGDVVLLKGSRGVKLEQAINTLRAAFSSMEP